MDGSAEQELAHLLATLRREGRQQSGLDPRLLPPDKPTAYRVADMVAEELGWPIAGWKIAAAKPEMQRQLRTDSPIYGRVYVAKSSPTHVEQARLCSLIPEVEYQAVLGSDLPPRVKPYTFDDVADAVASLHPGLELAECHFVHDGDFPPLPVILADGAGGSMIVYGPAITDWRKRDIVGQKAVLFCNGQICREGTAAAALDHPLIPLTWLANELSRTGIGLKAGQMISTGTLTGMVRPQANATYIADFGSLGMVEVALI